MHILANSRYFMFAGGYYDIRHEGACNMEG
jgi:hypothetical protein